MGLLDTVKGFLNIGGVKVKLLDVKTLVPKSGNQLTGKVQLTSKGDKQVLKMLYKFYLRKTTGRGENRQVKEFVIGQSTMTEPFEIKTGETRTLDFAISYSIDRSLADMGGVLGAVGKIGAFAAAEKQEYFVSAVCDVKGTALDPSDSIEVTLVD